MKTTNEFRIGNAIQVILKDGTVGGLITGIPDRYTILMHDNHKVPVEDVSPIPLTPEILKEWGFVAVENWGSLYYHIGRFAISGILGTNQYGFSWQKSPFDKAHGTMITAFSDLHELQNLYYASTGLELIAHSG